VGPAQRHHRQRSSVNVEVHVSPGFLIALPEHKGKIERRIISRSFPIVLFGMWSKGALVEWSAFRANERALALLNHVLLSRGSYYATGLPDDRAHTHVKDITFLAIGLCATQLNF
jgi:hypothetical protein